MRFKGRIRNDERDFGFIEATQGGQEIFVPRQGFTQRSGRPQVGQFVRLKSSSTIEPDVVPSGSSTLQLQGILSCRPCFSCRRSNRLCRE